MDGRIGLNTTEQRRVHGLGGGCDGERVRYLRQRRGGRRVFRVRQRTCKASHTGGNPMSNSIINRRELPEAHRFQGGQIPMELVRKTVLPLRQKSGILALP